MTPLRAAGRSDEPRVAKRPFRERRQIILGLIGVAVGLLAMLLSAPAAYGESSAGSQKAGVRDFAAYWAATRLLLNLQDPYSPSNLFDLQRAAGLQELHPLVMWNPPWAFAFTLPFGLVDFSVGQFLWLLTNVLAILVSAHLFWRLYGYPKDSFRWPWFLALTFVPTVFVLVLGQIAPLVLAGIAAFCFFEKQRRDLAAGAFLVLASVKPHFIYLFWLVLLLWLCHQRRWRVALGAATAGLIAGVLPLLFDPIIYVKYFALFQRTDLHLPMDLAAPTLRNVGKMLIQTESKWPQLALSAGACIWGFYYWRRHRENWQWVGRLPLILLVSLATSTYTWTFDQIIFLPAILQGAAWAIRRNRSWFTSVAVVMYLGIEAVHICLRFFVAEDIWFFWLAPLLLVNYLIFRWEAGNNGTDVQTRDARGLK